MKILGPTTMTNIIEDAFGEFATDTIFTPTNLGHFVGHRIINTDHDKFETAYDKTHDWIVPFARIVGCDDPEEKVKT